MTLPVFDFSSSQGSTGFRACLDRLRQTTAASGDAGRTVAAIIDDVRLHGDGAVVRYMRKWTDPDFVAERIRVSDDELAAAERSLDPVMRDTLTQAIEHVREYQRHIMPAAPKPVVIDGATLGLRFTPVDSVGLAVPGGKASYPSSVIMLAVPAMVAGVDAKQISVVTPPPTRRGDEPVSDVSPLVLATCSLLGVGNVYRIGGAQAIAALTLGTKTVRQADMIVGPGNIFVQLAKQQLAGQVGIDGFYGPSEIVVIADETADARRVAADLIAQAEHDPGKCFLLTWSKRVIDDVLGEIQKQTATRARQEAIASSLRGESCAVLVADQSQAVELANQIAPEHMTLAVSNPRALLEQIRHAGEIFLGDATPVAAGDYWSGPSHCLPTGTTARFTSGISVYTFLKRTGTVAYEQGMPAAAINAIARLAQAEGLDGHVYSVHVRKQ